MARKFKRNMMVGEELTLYILKYGPPKIRILSRVKDDGPVGNRIYKEYIITNKRKKDVNWDE